MRKKQLEKIDQSNGSWWPEQQARRADERLSRILPQPPGVGGFSTEDTLISFLPLVREMLDAHAAGLVAPLDGLDALHVEGVQIWFEEARRAAAAEQLRGRAADCSSSCAASVEIVSEQRRTVDVGEGHGEVADLAIGDRDDEPTRPVYLPGYVAWEHQLGHHDPLTDIFSLGMILASLACGLDFTEPDELRPFVAGRRNPVRAGTRPASGAGAGHLCA